jgi:transcription termination factor NusB
VYFKDQIPNVSLQAACEWFVRQRHSNSESCTAVSKQYQEDDDDKEDPANPEQAYSTLHLHIMEDAKKQAQEKIENKLKRQEEEKLELLEPKLTAQNEINL